MYLKIFLAKYAAADKEENPEPIIAIFLLIATQRYYKKGKSMKMFLMV